MADLAWFYIAALQNQVFIAVANRFPDAETWVISPPFLNDIYVLRGVCGKPSGKCGHDRGLGR
jgi:hypothetical protein